MEHELKNDNGPKDGLVGLIVAKVICCFAILLAATGGLAGASAWFLDGGAVWFALALAAVAAVGQYFGLRRRRRGKRPDPEPQNRGVRAL